MILSPGHLYYSPFGFYISLTTSAIHLHICRSAHLHICYAAALNVALFTLALFSLIMPTQFITFITG